MEKFDQAGSIPFSLPFSQQFDSIFNGNVAVLDIQTGETLYKEQIVSATSPEEQESFELYLNEIFVK